MGKNNRANSITQSHLVDHHDPLGFVASFFRVPLPHMSSPSAFCLPETLIRLIRWENDPTRSYTIPSNLVQDILSKGKEKDGTAISGDLNKTTGSQPSLDTDTQLRLGFWRKYHTRTPDGKEAIDAAVLLCVMVDGGPITRPSIPFLKIVNGLGLHHEDWARLGSALVDKKLLDILLVRVMDRAVPKYWEEHKEKYYARIEAIFSMESYSGKWRQEFREKTLPQLMAQ